MAGTTDQHGLDERAICAKLYYSGIHFYFRNEIENFGAFLARGGFRGIEAVYSLSAHFDGIAKVIREQRWPFLLSHFSIPEKASGEYWPLNDADREGFIVNYRPFFYALDTDDTDDARNAKWPGKNPLRICNCFYPADLGESKEAIFFGDPWFIQTDTAADPAGYARARAMIELELDRTIQRWRDSVDQDPPGAPAPTLDSVGESISSTSPSSTEQDRIDIVIPMTQVDPEHSRHVILFDKVLDKVGWRSWLADNKNISRTQATDYRRGKIDKNISDANRRKIEEAILKSALKLGL
jgi:hypothetical protein